MVDYEFCVTVEQGGATTVARVVGDVDVVTASALREQLDQLNGQVIVDISGVTFLDSSGISVLLNAYKRLDERLMLRNPSDHVRMILEVVGLEDLIE